MNRRHRIAALAALSVAGIVPAAMAVTGPTATATGTTGPSAGAVFDASNDTSPQAVGGETSPRGPATWTPNATPNRLTLNASFTGLTPVTTYVVVAYTDGFCTPTPGVTAFPSPSFTTDGQGKATIVNYTVNPAALNPTATLTVAQINSASIRQVVTNANGVNVPDATQTESCDATITR